MTEAVARWSSIRRSLPSPSQLRIDNPLPKLRTALQSIRVPDGLLARLRGAHPAWWLAAALMAVVLVQSWIIARRPDGSAALVGDRVAETDAGVVRPAEEPREESVDERVEGARPPVPDRGKVALPESAPTVASAATPAPNLRSTQGPRLLAFEYLTSARRPVTTIAGPIDIVTRAGPPRRSLIAVNGTALDQSGAELNMLVHRSVFADREVIVGFSDCLGATPGCERKEPFWLLLRRSQPPVFKRSPGLLANRNAGAVTAVPTGVHVDLGLWDGVRQTATLTSLDDIYVTRVREPARPLSGVDCRSVAAALESCAASRDCSSYESIVRAVPPARVASVQRLFHESTGLNEPMFRTVCVRSCELGLTPTSSLVRREVCSGAVRGQWARHN
jgi:hypothetical protein